MPEQRTHDDEAARLLAAIVTASDDAIISKRLDGEVTSWNRAAEQIFGYAAEEMIGRSISILAAPDRSDEMSLILDHIRRGERIDHHETKRRHKDGHIIDISLTVSPIFDIAGQIVGASKIVRDLTVQRHTERRLREVEAELSHAARLTEMGEMASALAHEVSQPLTAASNYLAAAGIMLEAANDPAVERARAVVNKAAAQITRATDVMLHLRTFVKKGGIERRDEPVANVIGEAADLALIGTRESGVKLQLRIAPHLPLVVIDKIQIQQVVVNLIRNAVQSMQASIRRELTIIAEVVEPHRIEISVTDTGPGIAPEIADRLFQPFVTTKPQGMGIGLSICRSIVESHGGQLSVKPNPEGGASFHFCLPTTEPLLKAIWR